MTNFTIQIISDSVCPVRSTRSIQVPLPRSLTNSAVKVVLRRLPTSLTRNTSPPNQQPIRHLHAPLARLLPESQCSALPRREQTRDVRREIRR